MSVRKIQLIPLFIFILTACGGGGSPSSNGDGSTTTTTTEGGTDVSTGTDQSTLVPALGTGSGNSFVAVQLTCH